MQALQRAELMRQWVDLDRLSPRPSSLSGGTSSHSCPIMPHPSAGPDRDLEGALFSNLFIINSLKDAWVCGTEVVLD